MVSNDVLWSDCRAENGPQDRVVARLTFGAIDLLRGGTEPGGLWMRG